MWQKREWREYCLSCSHFCDPEYPVNCQWWEYTNDYALKLVRLREMSWRSNMMQPKKIDCHSENRLEMRIWRNVPDASLNKTGGGSLRYEFNTRCNIEFRNLRWILQASKNNILDHTVDDYAPRLDVWRLPLINFWGAEERKLEALSSSDKEWIS